MLRPFLPKWCCGLHHLLSLLKSLVPTQVLLKPSAVPILRSSHRSNAGSLLGSLLPLNHPSLCAAPPSPPIFSVAPLIKPRWLAETLFRGLSSSTVSQFQEQVRKPSASSLKSSCQSTAVTSLTMPRRGEQALGPAPSPGVPGQAARKGAQAAQRMRNGLRTRGSWPRSRRVSSP